MTPCYTGSRTLGLMGLWAYGLMGLWAYGLMGLWAYEQLKVYEGIKK